MRVHHRHGSDDSTGNGTTDPLVPVRCFGGCSGKTVRLTVRLPNTICSQGGHGKSVTLLRSLIVKNYVVQVKRAEEKPHVHGWQKLVLDQGC